MRHVTDIQRRLIEAGFLPALNEQGKSNLDGKFGHDSLDAFNRFRATKGLGPVVKTSMEELNRLLFPEEQPVPTPKKPSILQDWLVGLATKKAVDYLKGLPAMNFLLGSKTVITGAIMIVVGAASLIAPVIGLGAIPGLDALTPGEAWTSITAGFGFIFLRGGIAKVGG